MRKITSFLYMCIYLTATGGQYVYPPSWEPFCNVFNSTEFVNITCNLKPDDSERLKLKDLNEYANNTADNVKYSVYWKCSPDAGVSMSLPMRINKIYSLRVFGCRIFEYFDDWNHESLGSSKDSLVYDELVDCILMFDIFKLTDIIGNFKNVSNDWMCGHDTTIKTSISRNISMDIIPSDLFQFTNYDDEDTLNNTFPGSDILSIIQNDYRPKCSFQNLELLEVVMSESLHYQTLNIIFKSVKKLYPSMRVFNYSHNGYTVFPQEWKDNMYRFPKLENIDYSYNFIADISNVDYFWDSKPGRQVVLDLRYNNITTLTAETVSKWKDLQDTFLDIRGNPLDCGCFKQEFIYKVQDDSFFDGQMQKYKYLQNMTCASPATAKGIKIIDLTKYEMGCEIPPQDLTIYLVVLAVTASILILLIILIFKFRKEIKLLLFVQFNILLPWDIDRSADKKRYDAFISYSSPESDWVVDYLAHKLESPFESHDALTLCIHERDFIGGKSILLNIIDSIENSRHTIVVLSRQFIKNIWTMAEFKEAYEESVTKKRRHLIIIKYEDIPEEEMDSMLKRCLRTFTYIDVKDPRFMDRLRFSLAIKSR